MNRIAVVTSTRAEYGLLSPIIKKLREQENDELTVELIVTGTHLSDSYGYTIREIEEDNIRIDHVIRIPVESATEIDISDNQASTLVQFTHLFFEKKYNAVILLGDRYETLGIAIAAGNTRTPIFHLCGGDTTEGAIDEWIRHSITKISYLHFVTNEDSKRRVIQLGESPNRVFNYGSTSIDNILNLADMTKAEALRSIGFKECNYALCTYHPVTMDNSSSDLQIMHFCEAVKAFPELLFIITKANSDQGGAHINELLDEAATKINNICVFSSLGAKRYLSLMKYAEFVLGNSSSGIVEAPAFHVPTINVGDRQKGRLQTDSVINCGSKQKEIMDAINIALSREHRAICQKVVSPYGDGYAAQKIAAKTVEVVLNGGIDLKKSFYDLK